MMNGAQIFVSSSKTADAIRGDLIVQKPSLFTPFSAESMRINPKVNAYGTAEPYPSMARFALALPAIHA